MALFGHGSKCLTALALFLMGASPWQANAGNPDADGACTSESPCGETPVSDADLGLLQMGHAVSTMKSGSQPAASAQSLCRDYTRQYDSYDDEKRFGARDADGDPCGFYGENKDQCGLHDVDDFIANEMCCHCGGGSTSTKPRSLAVNNASVFLSEGSDCPDGFQPINTFAACRAALDMVAISGMNFNSADSETNWPKGCYHCKDVDGCGNGVYFNSHSQGKIVSGTRRFCQRGYDPKAVKTLFVGDSDVDYWDSSVGFPGSFNVGVGGYDTTDVIKEVDRWVDQLSPKWVVIVCGENDIGGSRAATNKAFERFKLIVEKFISDGSSVIYLGTKPEPDSKNLFREYTHYDEAIRKFAKEQAKSTVINGTVVSPSFPPFQMIDVFKSFTSEKELYNTDGLHMSRLGYKFWNGWVKLAMDSLEPCIRWRDGVCVDAPTAQS